jgi:hypothetical protein
VMDLLDCAEDHRRGALDGPAHQVPRAVALMDLGEPPFDRHGLTVRAGGHVAARQHAGQYVRRRVELGAQDIGESAFAGFDDGAGMVGDQPAQHGIGVLGIAQVPGAVELVQAGGGEARCVADVVQPSGGFQQVGVRAENRCQAARPGSDALDVRSAARKGFLEEFPGELSGPRCQRVHQPRLGSRGGTFQGGGRPSGRRLVPRQGPIIRQGYQLQRDGLGAPEFGLPANPAPGNMRKLFHAGALGALSALAVQRESSCRAAGVSGCSGPRTRMITGSSAESWSRAEAGSPAPPVQRARSWRRSRMRGCSGPRICSSTGPDVHSLAVCQASALSSGF